MCSGYAETLRNFCACRGIECNSVRSDSHAFNQVKIGGQWYYFDLTWERDNIKRYGTVKKFLQSKETFQSYGGASHIPWESQTTYESSRDYNERNTVSSFFEKIIANVGQESVKKAERYMNKIREIFYRNN